eukprot:9893129-Prorocentrum_lima.AAC.1
MQNGMRRAIVDYPCSSEACTCVGHMLPRILVIRSCCTTSLKEVITLDVAALDGGGRWNKRP